MTVYGQYAEREEGDREGRRVTATKREEEGEGADMPYLLSFLVRAQVRTAVCV